ncbi:unnamed protein product [Orchesella dallaii]|uniref:Uncharacterized protein n=1 Tax=Orchesella dallaii TaxID=48710 RepID=A0ABP1R4Q4_9HEXA
MMNLGREIRLPIDNRLESVKHDDISFASRLEYQTELVTKLQSIYALAKSSIDKAHKQQAKHYDKRHKKFIVKEGDLVLLKTHFLSDKSKGFAKKLAFRYEGPYRINKIRGKVHFELTTVDGEKSVGIHNAKNLRRYFDKPSDVLDEKQDTDDANNYSNVDDNDETQSVSSEMLHSMQARYRALLEA